MRLHKQQKNHLTPRGNSAILGGCLCNPVALVLMYTEQKDEKAFHKADEEGV
jgi:hypothetical protein